MHSDRPMILAQLFDARDRLTRAAMNLRASDTLGCALNIGFLVAAIGVNAERIVAALASRKGRGDAVLQRHIDSMAKIAAAMAARAKEDQAAAASLWVDSLGGATSEIQAEAKAALLEAIRKL